MSRETHLRPQISPNVPDYIPYVIPYSYCPLAFPLPTLPGTRIIPNMTNLIILVLGNEIGRLGKKGKKRKGISVRAASTAWLARCSLWVGAWVGAWRLLGGRGIKIP